MLANVVRPSGVRDFMYSSSVIMRNNIPVDKHLQVSIGKNGLTHGHITLQVDKPYNKDTKNTQRERSKMPIKESAERAYRMRQRRLLQLIQTHFDGTQSRLAEAIGRSPQYVSFLLADINLAHHKNLGDPLARHIETVCNLPKGWLDNDEPERPTAEEDFGDLPKPPGYDELQPVTPPSGAAYRPATLLFRHDWLAAQGLSPEDVRLATAEGLGMAPLIEPDDVMLVAIRRQKLVDGKVFAFLMNGEMVIRRTFLHSNKVELQADNPFFKGETLTLEEVSELKVIGQILWVGGKI